MAASIPTLQTYMAAGELDLAPGANVLTWVLPETPEKWGWTLRGQPTDNIFNTVAPDKNGVTLNNHGVKVRIFLWAWCPPRSVK